MLQWRKITFRLLMKMIRRNNKKKSKREIKRKKVKRKSIMIMKMSMVMNPQMRRVRHSINAFIEYLSKVKK